MNCVKGDLAVIVRACPAYAKHIGKIVRCVSLTALPLSVPCWEVDPPVFHGTTKLYCEDSNLRPLRDNPGQDETLHWLDVPTKETA